MQEKPPRLGPAFWWLLVLVFCIISLLALAEYGSFYETVSSLESVKKIEAEERIKLKIPSNVVIEYSFDIDDRSAVDGFVETTSRPKFPLHLKKRGHSSTVRHEIYHVYRLSIGKINPKDYRGIDILREEFLAYAYGYLGINFELSP